MKKCDCYHVQSKTKYTYNPVTGDPIKHDIEIGVCWGTKETDECDCGGDEAKCDFYPEVREKALKKQESKFGEWVSVDDRLPEKHERVLCYYKYEPESPDVICENTYHGGGRWLSEGSKVTHWMSLPQPPKGDKND